MTKKRIAGVFVLCLGILVAVSVLSTYMATCGKIATTPARVVSKMVETDNVIDKYEWFYDAYHKCKSYDRQLRNAMLIYDIHVSSMSVSSHADRIEKARLLSIILGIRNERADMVEKYNANSSKLTQKVFKGWSLPYRLTVVEDTTMEVSQ